MIKYTTRVRNIEEFMKRKKPENITRKQGCVDNLEEEGKKNNQRLTGSSMRPPCPVIFHQGRDPTRSQCQRTRDDDQENRQQATVKMHLSGFRASARAHPAATPPPPSPKLHPSRERRGLRAHGRRGRAPVASNRQKVTSEVALRDHCSNGPKHVPPRRLGTIYGMEVAPSSGFLPSSCDDFRICPFYENYLPRYYPAPSLLWAPALQVPIVLQERC
ncbi:hypothetical protein KM043_016786 [Ampulex compressa]|nr:hypothetical protein KM043_016786 [Ampulex compressa]